MCTRTRAYINCKWKSRQNTVITTKWHSPRDILRCFSSKHYLSVLRALGGLRWEVGFRANQGLSVQPRTYTHAHTHAHTAFLNIHTSKNLVVICSWTIPFTPNRTFGQDNQFNVRLTCIENGRQNQTPWSRIGIRIREKPKWILNDCLSFGYPTGVWNYQWPDLYCVHECM